MSNVDQLYAEAEKLKDAGDYATSVAKLNELLQVDPQHVLAHMTLAVVLGKLGRHEEAVQHGQRVCELDPNDPFHFTAMSVTFQRAFAGTQNHAYIHLAEEAMARAHMLQGRH